LKRNLALDGIRGYAAIIVVFYHTMISFNPKYNQFILNTSFLHLSRGADLQAKFLMTIFNGQLAVTFFFLLSGIVLFQSLDKPNQQGFFATITNFSLKRIARIYPTLIVYLVFFFGLFQILQYIPHYGYLFHLFSYKSLINNILLYGNKISGPTWTLQLEMLAVPFILLAFFGYKLLGVSGLFIFLAYSLLSFEHPWLTFNIPLINSYLFIFALGFFVPTPIGKQIFSLFKSKDCILLLFLAVMMRQLFPLQDLLLLLVQGLFIFLFIGVIYHHPVGVIYKFLTNKYSLYLGRISYSFYLYNWIFLIISLQIARFFVLPFKYYLISGFLLGILAVLITIPFAHFSEKYVEHRFLNFKFIRKFSTGRLFKSSYLLTEGEE